MPDIFDDEDWDLLISRIKEKKCTPFIGAGACSGSLPLGSDIVKKWVLDFDLPKGATDDLVRVAQYLALKRDPVFPKEQILREFNEVGKVPNFDEPDEPHGVLADLPLPVYLTTNYDTFMSQALSLRKKAPESEYCRWNEYVKKISKSIFETRTAYVPDEHTPLVYHLHGRMDVSESIVLTEDDYLDFLVRISTDELLIPPRIQQALAGASLLFVGYSLVDWDFRVIFRGLVTNKDPSLRRISVTVQLPPESQHQRDYLDKYFSKQGMKVYWGSAREFLFQLRERCRKEGIIK